MKIVEVTPHRLILHQRTYIALLWGIPFSLACLYFIFGPRSDTYSLTCRRSQHLQGMCISKRSGLLRTKERSYPLKEILGAKVVVRSRNPRGQEVYTVVLKTTAGEFEFTSKDTSYQDKQDAVKLVNTFLRNNTLPSVSFKDNSANLIRVVGFFLLVIGLGGTFFVSQPVTVILEEKDNRLLLEKKIIFNDSLKKYKLAEVAEVEKRGGTVSGYAYTHIDLVLVSGKKVELLAFIGGLDSDGKASLEQLKRFVQDLTSQNKNGPLSP